MFARRRSTRVYDALNRIVNAKDRTSGEVIATYVYDSGNRRVRKEVAEGYPGEGVTEFAFAGWRVLEERDGAGALAADYVYGLYLDEALAMKSGYEQDNR